MKQGSTVGVIVEKFRTEDDVLERLNGLVLQNSVSAGSFTALGTLQEATVGYFTGGGKYSSIPLEGPLEVSACVGNVSLRDGSPFVHAHIVLSDKAGRAYGGHLMPGCTVGPTFEVVLHRYDGMDLVRKLDSKTGLFLLET